MHCSQATCCTVSQIPACLCRRTWQLTMPVIHPPMGSTKTVSQGLTRRGSSGLLQQPRSFLCPKSAFLSFEPGTCCHACPSCIQSCDLLSSGVRLQCFTPDQSVIFDGMLLVHIFLCMQGGCVGFWHMLFMQTLLVNDPPVKHLLTLSYWAIADCLTHSFDCSMAMSPSCLGRCRVLVTKRSSPVSTLPKLGVVC